MCQIYLHQCIRIARVRIVKPFLILSIITLAIVAGGVRLASNKNHWEDVIAGFVLGAVIAAYLVTTELSSHREKIVSEHDILDENTSTFESSAELSSRSNRKLR